VNLLAIQLKRIGDVILTTAALRELLAARPDARITLAIHAGSAGLVPMLPADEVIVLRGGPSDLGAYGRILGGGFDACIDFSGTDRSALVASASRAAERIAFSRFRGKPFRRFVFNRFVDSSVRDRHTADHFCDLLAPLGVRPTDGALPLLRLTAEARAEASAALARAGISGRYAVIHPGTARAEKLWVASRWVEVARALREDFGLPCVITGAGTGIEVGPVGEVVSAGAGVDLSGQLGLPGLAALVAGATILCGVDSAPMHIADAFGTPLVALFGPTHPYHWGPRNARAIVLTPSGRRERFSPSDPGGPTEKIPADLVVGAIGELL